MKTLFDYRVEWFLPFPVGENTLILFARTSGELWLGGVREESGDKLRLLLDSGLRNILHQNNILFIEKEHEIFLESTTWRGNPSIGQALPSKIEEILLSLKDLIISVNELSITSDEESEKQ